MKTPILFLALGLSLLGCGPQVSPPPAPLGATYPALRPLPDLMAQGAAPQQAQAAQSDLAARRSDLLREAETLRARRLTD